MEHWLELIKQMLGEIDCTGNRIVLKIKLIFYSPNIINRGNSPPTGLLINEHVKLSVLYVTF